jgi:hypothetical protein
MWGWSSACIYNRQLCNVRGGRKKEGRDRESKYREKRGGGEKKERELA